MKKTMTYTPWVTFNNLTQTYDTPDGTRVPAELVNNFYCLADVMYIAIIRESQRTSKEKLRNI